MHNYKSIKRANYCLSFKWFFLKADLQEPNSSLLPVDKWTVGLLCDRKNVSTCTAWAHRYFQYKWSAVTSFLAIYAVSRAFTPIWNWTIQTALKRSDTSSWRGTTQTSRKLLIFVAAMFISFMISWIFCFAFSIFVFAFSIFVFAFSIVTRV